MSREVLILVSSKNLKEPFCISLNNFYALAQLLTVCGNQWCFLEMLGAIGNRTAQWPAAFFSVSVESIRKILPCIPTYTPIWSATSSDKPFSFTISFFTSSHGSYDGMTEWAERSPGFKINPYEHCSVSTHLVEFIHCWTDGAELVIWNATHSKHPIKNTSIIDLEENKKLLNDWFKGIVKKIFWKQQVNWCGKTLIWKSPMSSSLRISWTIFRHSASGIMASYCPAMSKSCQTHKCDHWSTAGIFTSDGLSNQTVFCQHKSSRSNRCI